jgi:hypothetical protein
MENNIKKKFSNLKIDLIRENKLNYGKTIIVNRNRFDPVMRSLWCASILNIYKKQKIILFSKKNYFFTNTLFKNFGVENIEYLSARNLIFKNIFNSIFFFLYSIICYLRYSLFGIDRFIKCFNHKKVYLGLQIHESYIKKNKYYLDENFLLPFFYFIKIFNTFIYINYLEKYIEQNNIKNIIINKKNYFGIDSLLFLIAKKNKINCILVSLEDIIKNQNNSIYKKRYFFSKKELLSRVPKKKIESFLKKKNKGLSDRDAKNSHAKKFYLTKDDVQKIFKKKRKKIILFCPHAFSDSCSQSGEFLYRDFFEYYHKTIEEIKKIKDINWIVKMHPSSKMHNEESIVKKFTDEIISENIHIISNKYNILSIIENVDAIVTAKGTIILEATILGKKVIGYKNNRFLNTDIFIKYNNKTDYYNKLRFKNLDLNVSQKDKNLAKKILFLYSVKAYGTKDNLLQDIRLKNSIQRKKYYLNLFKKLKKGKEIIYNSSYYKEAKRKLLN